jgi:hypothetical protein
MYFQLRIKVKYFKTYSISFYFRGYKLQSAEAQIKAAGQLLREEAVSEESIPTIESQIDKSGLLVEDAATNAFRMVTSTLRVFKGKIISLKEK